MSVRTTRATAAAEAQRAEALREFVQQNYCDAHRITVDVSATGKGHHLRWNYSDNQIDVQEQAEEQPQREPSPALSYASTHLVDDEGDSQMGDEDERPRTPPRLGEYDPGSVVLTPKKDAWRALDRTDRIGGGLDWWHHNPAVEGRVVYMGDRDVLPEHEPAGRTRFEADVLHLIQNLPSSTTRDDDDDTLSLISVASSQATDIIDPRKPPRPTLFNGEKPIIRHHWDEAGHSEHNVHGRLSTIQEESSLNARPSSVPEYDCGRIHLFRDENGQWVREGSLGPDVPYQFNRALIPPRIDAPQAGPLSQAGPSSHAGSPSAHLQRTDTEPIVEGRKTRARRAAPPPATNLRRSARTRKS